LNLNRPGEVAISLGTSDVLFGVTNEPKPNENEGSILIHPLDPCNYMMMLVFKNGAMTRNFIKNSNFAEDKDWSKFNEAIKKTSVGSNNKISFYFKETEITPPVFHTGILQNLFRIFLLIDLKKIFIPIIGVVKFNNENNMLTEEITTLDCRGLIESQALSYKLHSRLLGLEKISSVIVTGGGSVNKEILQIIADVFECNVVPSSLANTAASGAAIRALDAHFKSIKMVVQSGVSILSDEITYPIVENFSIYRNLFERYAKLENTAVNFLNAQNIWLSIGQELGFF
jgi:xylulokinase